MNIQHYVRTPQGDKKIEDYTKLMVLPHQETFSFMNKKGIIHVIANKSPLWFLKISLLES